MLFLRSQSLKLRTELSLNYTKLKVNWLSFYARKIVLLLYRSFGVKLEKSYRLAASWEQYAQYELGDTMHGLIAVLL